MDQARIAITGVASDAGAEVHECLVDPDAHRRRVRFHPPSSEDVEHLLNARFVTDRWKWVVLLSWRFGRILAGLAMDLVELLGFVVVRLEIAVFQRPLRREAVFVPEPLKIPFPQAKQRGAVHLGV